MPTAQRSSCRQHVEVLCAAAPAQQQLHDVGGCGSKRWIQLGLEYLQPDAARTRSAGRNRLRPTDHSLLLHSGRRTHAEREAITHPQPFLAAPRAALEVRSGSLPRPSSCSFPTTVLGGTSAHSRPQARTRATRQPRQRSPLAKHTHSSRAPMAFPPFFAVMAHHPHSSHRAASPHRHVPSAVKPHEW